MRCGTISSCQSAATSEIVKHCWSRVHSCKWRYSKCPDVYLYLYSDGSGVNLSDRFLVPAHQGYPGKGRRMVVVVAYLYYNLK